MPLLHIRYVTGIHNHVGNVADYFADPTFITTKLRRGKEVSDVQTTFQGTNIALATATPQPYLLNNFKHLLLEDEHLSATQVSEFCQRGFGFDVGGSE